MAKGSDNELIWYMDMLFITTNGRSTRFLSKLGEGFFS
jgi:hypothetical protein